MTPGDPDPRGTPQTHETGHAGLALLHPYLPELFNELGGISDGNRRMPARSLPRAAAALHHLSGLPPEAAQNAHADPLTCLLLGQPPEAQLPCAELTPDDVTLMDCLLDAFTRHWSPMRNTNRDGLRQSFVRRPGTIDTKTEPAQLIVEPRPFDMLLNQLPWPYSFVKLPWMPQGCRVTWKPRTNP